MSTVAPQDWDEVLTTDEEEEESPGTVKDDVGWKLYKAGESKLYGFPDTMSVAAFHHVSETCKQRIVNLEKDVETLEKKAEALERFRKRKIEEIQIEKVVLKCLAKSVESIETSFDVDYGDVKGLSNLQNNTYFLERCHNLGLDVGFCWRGPTILCLSHKTTAIHSA